MMREIKFRAYRESLGMSDPFVLGQSPNWTKGHARTMTVWGFPCDGVEVMQFTGLKDKNGVEIYEGDILEEDIGYIFEVAYDQEWAKFKLQWRTKAIQFPEWNRGKRMGIIGNIHQNPELLK